MEQPKPDANGEANWHRLTIDEPALTDGNRLRVFVDSLLASGAPDIKAVVIAAVEGSGDPHRGITQLGCARLSKQEFLNRLMSTGQLDWANLLFFDALPHDMVRRICEELSVAEAIGESVFAIRVIDDSALDVFTGDTGLATWLTGRYPNAKRRYGPLSEMDFPA